MPIRFLFLGLWALSMIQPVSAAGFTSAYTKLDFDDCTVLSADDFAAEWACPGYKGYPVRVVEADLRFYISYGFGAKDEPAAGQTLAPFNTVGDTMEWRLSNKGGAFKPIATILRWFTDDGQGERYQVLVVTKIAEGNTCQIAQIDAGLVKDANVLARKIADEQAEGFDCASTEPMQIPS